MKTKRGISLLMGAMLVGALFVLPSGAQAVPCGYAGISPTSGICLDGDNNDTAADLNGALFGGFDGWMELTKAEGSGDNDYWSGDFTGSSGNFTLDATLWSDYANLAVVLKGGNIGVQSLMTPGEQQKWSAYMLLDDVLNYSWAYAADTTKSISHLTLYARGEGTPPSGGDTPVPEPATMLLFGTGLLGFAGAFRKYLR